MLNFTMRVAVRDDVRWGSLYENGTAFGSMADVISRKADLTLGKYAITNVRNEFMTPTISYLSSPLIVVVPIGEPYSSLEKLLKPFGVFTWQVVITFLVSAIVFISYVKIKTRASIRSFIFGRNANSEYFNTFVAFLGQNIPDQRVPLRNFARTLFCIFMLYGLVIRSSYSGALFKFLKTDNIRKPHAKSIDEMVERNFKFYMQIPTEYLVREFTKVYKQRVVIRPNETASLQQKMTNLDFKGGLLSSLEQILYFNRKNYRNFTLKVCPEVLYNFQYVIYFQKNSPFVRSFNKHIEDYEANGILSYLVDEFIPSQNENLLGPKAPKALVFDQVSGSFWVLFIGCLISCLVFYLERWCITYY